MKSRIWLLALLTLAVSGCGYNRIQQLDELVTQNRANIEAELMRRNDLIPNLVRTVEEAAEFEQETFTRVAEARSGLNGARERMAQAVQGESGASELNEAANAVSDQLRLFINVAVEAYPQLNANQNFLGLQDELTETENRIAVARRDYNEAVATHNTYIRQFPQVITAKVIGAERAEPFEAPESATDAPTVEFEN